MRNCAGKHGQPMGDYRFPPECHIRRGADFQRTYNRRIRASDDWLLLFGCPNELPYSRLGLSVSRKVGKAVVRNRWKRLIREAFRLTREKLPQGLDLIVIPRAGTEPELRGLMQSLPRLAQRIARKLPKPKP